MQDDVAVTAARRLHRTGLAAFGYSALAAFASIVAGWPAQFGGRGDPAEVAAEFVSRGTAAAPPLFVLLVLGGAALCVRGRGGWGVAAAGVLSVLGVLFVIAGFGEMLAPDPVTTPRPVLVVAGVLAVAWGTVLAYLGAAFLAGIVRARRATATPV